MHLSKVSLSCWLQSVRKCSILHPSVNQSQIYFSRCHRSTWTSKAVRETFVEFFAKEQHQVIRSSSVLPWNDNSLFFVNAGMNQFKPVLLGRAAPPCPRATNSQKCIRVGGKHNDLNEVGTDSYHHTFFEMLGSWSFGDYFKSEACKLAWQLLTEVYELPADRLFVTYFSGDAALGIPPDLETRNVWLQIGLPASHVLPFGLRDNFWEMGAVGPCGPCTEIHYCRDSDPDTAASRVNAGHENVIELWNIVFVQYERLSDGSVSPLPRHHVDTGMGLERLTATLNGLTSNYDTDLFKPLFDSIQQVSGAAAYSGSFSGPSASLDTGYRVMADHARMAVVALADGVLPNTSQKLRQVLHRLYRTAQQQFGLTADQQQQHGCQEEEQHWLCALSAAVVESLRCAYPELLHRLDAVNAVLQHELRLYNNTSKANTRSWEQLVSLEPRLQALRDGCSQAVLSGVKQLLPVLQEAAPHSQLPVDKAVRLNREFGASLEMIEEVAALFDLTVNRADFDKELKRAKRLERSSRKDVANWWGHNLDDIAVQLQERNVPLTSRESVHQYDCHIVINNDDSGACDCSGGNRTTVELSDGSQCVYVYDVLDTVVAAIIAEGKVVDSIQVAPSSPVTSNIGIVLRESNFYSAAGGQVSDRGVISLPMFTSTAAAAAGDSNVNNSDSGDCKQRQPRMLLNVAEVEEVTGFVIHWGSLVVEADQAAATSDQCLQTGDRAECILDAEHRLGCSQHHTATHLLLKAIQQEAGPDLSGCLPSQMSSHVAADHLRLGVTCYGRLDPAHLLAAEGRVQEWLRRGGAVTRQLLPLSEAVLLPELHLLPGSVYQDSVSVVTARGERAAAVELCCGTHLRDVAHVADFILTDLGTGVGAGLRSLAAVCGARATSVRRRGAEVQESIRQRRRELYAPGSSATAADRRAAKQWAEAAQKEMLPPAARTDLRHFIATYDNYVHSAKIDGNLQAVSTMLQEMEQLHEQQPTGALVHVMSSKLGNSLTVLKGTYSIFGDRSYLLLVHVKDAIRARAMLHKSAISRGGSASAWLSLLQRHFPTGRLKQGTNPAELANFKVAGVTSCEVEAVRDQLLRDCRQYIAAYEDDGAGDGVADSNT